MKKAIVLLLVAGLVAFMGCATTKPVTATSNPVGSKTGVASEFWILGLPPLSSAPQGGIVNAAKKGGITKISTVDQKVEWFVIFSNVNTVVTGE